jgi:hypothetical protein
MLHKNFILLFIILTSICTSAQNLQWVKCFGDGKMDQANSITHDKYGNTYTTGTFNGNIDFDSGPDTLRLSSYYGSVFILKYDAFGKCVWAKILEGRGIEDFL